MRYYKYKMYTIKSIDFDIKCILMNYSKLLIYETNCCYFKLSSAASTPEWDNRDSVPLPSPFPDSGPEADRFLDLRDCLGGRRHIKMEVSSTV